MHFEDPKSKKRRKLKQKIAHSYASKPKTLNWHDAYARAVFYRKPYHMVKNERLWNEEEGREETDDRGDH